MHKYASPPIALFPDKEKITLILKNLSLLHIVEYHKLTIVKLNCVSLEIVHLNIGHVSLLSEHTVLQTCTFYTFTNVRVSTVILNGM